MFNFIEEGYQKEDKVWNMMTQKWETIVQIALSSTYPIVTKTNSYTSDGCGLSGETTPTIYPNEFNLTIPIKAYERPLRDKDFVECRDNGFVFTRILRFYDAVNNCTFSAIPGNRNGSKFDNYKKVPMPDWAKELKDKLED